MNLRVGIIGEVPGWKSILQQEGIPHAEAGNDFSPEEFSVLVVSDPVDSRWASRIRDFLGKNGAIFCSAAVYRVLAGITTSRAFVSYVLPETDSHYAGVGLVDIATECEIPAGTSAMRTDHGVPAVLEGRFGGGHVVVVPFDCARLAGDLRVARKSFYAKRSRLPFERVSTVHRGGVRKLAARAIERLHHMRNLPHAHLWYYPQGERSIFNFRVDTDGATEEEIRSLASVLAKHNILATWFIHVRAHEQYLGAFREFRGHELALHCYEHKIFDDAELDAKNISKGIDALRGAGITVSGFAAPYGMWDAKIAAAIGRFGFEYSSEFAYDYDNLPSWPIIGERSESTLQIPVHPISIGSLRRQSFTEAEMNGYFTHVVESILAVHDPLFFYHHPKNDHHAVLEELFTNVRSAGIRPMTMKEFSLWWKRRCAVPLQLKLTDSRLVSDRSGSDPEVRLRITRADGSETMAPMAGSIDLNQLQWTKPGPVAHPPDIERIRRFNRWIPINMVEDRVTGLIRRTKL